MLKTFLILLSLPALILGFFALLLLIILSNFLSPKNYSVLQLLDSDDDLVYCFQL